MRRSVRARPWSYRLQTAIKGKEGAVFGYGLLGTILFICLIVWLDSNVYRPNIDKVT
jgi:hypothetical protein